MRKGLPRRADTDRSTILLPPPVMRLLASAHADPLPVRAKAKGPAVTGPPTSIRRRPGVNYGTATDDGCSHGSSRDWGKRAGLRCCAVLSSACRHRGCQDDGKRVARPSLWPASVRRKGPAEYRVPSGATQARRSCPNRERLRADHKAGKAPIRSNEWIDLLGERLEVSFLKRAIRGDAVSIRCRSPNFRMRRAKR